MLALVVTVAALVGLDALAWVGEVAAYGTWWSAGQPAGLYDNRPGERPRLRPGARLRGLRYAVSINTLGFRGPELAEPRPPDALRVWCMGGSTTFDIYAPDDASTWPAVLGERLAAARPDRRVEVLNAGIPGEVLDGSIADVERLGSRVRPDYVVIHHGPNDLRQELGTRGLPTRPSAVRPPDFALVRVIARSALSWGPERPPRELLPGDLAPVEGRLRRAMGEIRRIGAVPVLATHALAAAPDADSPDELAGIADAARLLDMDAASALRAFELYNTLVRTLAAKERVPLADVRAAVPADPALWGDGTHFRAGGSRLAGEAVAEVIVEAEVR